MRKKNEQSILVHAWRIHKYGARYFLPFTHWIYIKEIRKYYNEVVLVSPTEIINRKESENLVQVDFENIKIYELPDAAGYIPAIRNFFSYVKAYNKFKYCDQAYARYPVPFGWLQIFFFKEKRKIIHFVGDPVDTVKTNPNISWLKSKLLTMFFMPEHLMYMKASRKAEVYTNGFQIAERIKNYNVSAMPMISSTLNDQDYYFDEKKKLNENSLKFVYVGYLRKAKGVETLIYAFKQIKMDFPEAEFTIVGSGESEKVLKEIIEKEKIFDVKFLGHIDDREKLNQILRSHDIFCFASLSEGSPRVILEAMANGLPVVSTPVGSLPKIFENKKDILFANYNDPVDFAKKTTELIKMPLLYTDIRFNSFKKVRGYTIDSFIKRIFYLSKN